MFVGCLSVPIHILTISQLGLLVPPATSSRQQNRELRGGNQENSIVWLGASTRRLHRCILTYPGRVLLVPLDTSVPSVRPTAYHRLPLVPFGRQKASLGRPPQLVGR